MVREKQFRLLFGRTSRREPEICCVSKRRVTFDLGMCGSSLSILGFPHLKAGPMWFCTDAKDI